jgi:dCMP deaminase
MDDIALMKMAYELAKDSKDPSTQNGAILVAEGGTEPLAIGINEFPLNVEDKPERWDRPLKYEYIEHAEKNVIFDAAWRGVATEGLIMYCCWAACTRLCPSDHSNGRQETRSPPDTGPPEPQPLVGKH